MNDVVVGVDRSDTARRAAEKAASLAAAYGANLHLVMCAEPDVGVTAGVGSDTFHSDLSSDAEQYLKQLAFELPYDQITHGVAKGDPADGIVNEAKRVQASTIVVGNVRTQGMARVLGSVASSVVRKAHCDVLIAHTS